MIKAYYPFGMLMPGRKYVAGNLYRYGFNGQEKEPNLNESVTSALYWEYDGRIGRRWNVDPKPNSFTSPFNCLGANPLKFNDPYGDTLKLGGNLSISKHDVLSIVDRKNHQYVSFGSDNSVSLNFKALNKSQIDKLIKNDKGLEILKQIVDSRLNYLYEASEFGFFRDSKGTYVGVILRQNPTSQSSIINASMYGLDSRNSNSFLPREGYDGQVIIDTKTTWDEDNQGISVSKSRASMVFHELAENYFRTDFGASYNPKIQVMYHSGLTYVVNPFSIKGAHKLSIDCENSWKNKSSTPGEILGRNVQSVAGSERNLFGFRLSIYVRTGSTDAAGYLSTIFNSVY